MSNDIEITWTDVEALIDRLSKEFILWTPDLIIAVPRGGFVPARLLADSLNVKNMMSLPIGLTPINSTSGLRVLIVDDICDTGKALTAIKMVRPHWRSLTLHVKKSTPYKPDYVGDVVPDEWIIYPWERYEYGKNR